MTGKDFEQQFKKSIPDKVFCYRLKDSTASFSSDSTSFAVHNISDFFAFYNNKLYFFELKCHKGKSLPFNCIRKTQLSEMTKASVYKGIESYLVVNFLDINDYIYIIDMNLVKEEIDKNIRKSLSLDFCKNHGIAIKKYKKRVKEYYSLADFFHI